MMSVIPRFNMRRVLFDYSRGLYLPAAGQYRRLAADGFTGARTLADWKQRVRAAWTRVSLKLISDTTRDLPRGERLRLRVAAGLNGLSPADVRIEFVARRLLPEADLSPPPLCSYAAPQPAGVWHAAFKATDEQDADGAVIFALDVEPPECGQFQHRGAHLPVARAALAPLRARPDEVAVTTSAARVAPTVRLGL